MASRRMCAVDKVPMPVEPVVDEVLELDPQRVMRRLYRMAVGELIDHDRAAVAMAEGIWGEMVNWFKLEGNAAVMPERAKKRWVRSFHRMLNRLQPTMAEVKACDVYLKKHVADLVPVRAGREDREAQVVVLPQQSGSVEDWGEMVKRAAAKAVKEGRTLADD